MKLDEFLLHLNAQEGLVIDIEKHTETLDAVVDSLNTNLELIIGTLARYAPSETQLKALDKNEFYSLAQRMTNLGKGPAFFGDLADAVLGIGNACHYLIDELPATVVAESATAQEGGMLFGISVMMNALDALTRYVNDMFADITGTPNAQPAAMIKLMKRDVMSTVQVVALAHQSSDVIVDQLLAIPDLQISKDVAVRAGSGAKCMGVISLRWNPIFVARMMLAQRRIRKLKLLLEEKRLIEARIAMYIENSNGNLSPAAEKAVKYYQEVVVKLTAEIERIGQ